MEPKVETWSKKRVIVVRDVKGRILTWTPYKNINLQAAKRIYKDRGTFRKGVKISTTNLTNVVETAISTQGRMTFKKNKRGQYYIKVIIKNKNEKPAMIVARSNAAIIVNRAVAERLKEQAYDRLMKNLARELSFGYDLDEGERIFKTIENKTIDEGFVYYYQK